MRDTGLIIAALILSLIGVVSGITGLALGQGNVAQETPKVFFPPLPEEPIKVIVIGSDQCQPCTLLQSVELPNLYKTGWNETQIVYHKAPVGLLPTVPLLLRYEGGVLKSSHTGYLPAVALTRFYYTGKVK